MTHQPHFERHAQAAAPPEASHHEDFVTCSVCHGDAPARQVVRLGGRVQCFACAAAWFGEDDEAEE